MSVRLILLLFLCTSVWGDPHSHRCGEPDCSFSTGFLEDFARCMVPDCNFSTHFPQRFKRGLDFLCFGVVGFFQSVVEHFSVVVHVHSTCPLDWPPPPHPQVYGTKLQDFYRISESCIGVWCQTAFFLQVYGARLHFFYRCMVPDCDFSTHFLQRWNTGVDHLCFLVSVCCCFYCCWTSEMLL